MFLKDGLSIEQTEKDLENIQNLMRHVESTNKKRLKFKELKRSYVREQDYEKSAKLRNIERLCEEKMVRLLKNLKYDVGEFLREKCQQSSPKFIDRLF